MCGRVHPVSVYYWGCEDPDGVCAPGYNTLPKTRMFRDAVLTFYANVTQRLNKPMMISETAALFNTDRLGASEVRGGTVCLPKRQTSVQCRHPPVALANLA